MTSRNGDTKKACENRDCNDRFVFYPEPDLIRDFTYVYSGITFPYIDRVPYNNLVCSRREENFSWKLKAWKSGLCDMGNVMTEQRMFGCMDTTRFPKKDEIVLPLPSNSSIMAATQGKDSYLNVDIIKVPTLQKRSRTTDFLKIIYLDMKLANRPTWNWNSRKLKIHGHCFFTYLFPHVYYLDEKGDFKRLEVTRSNTEIRETELIKNDNSYRDPGFCSKPKHQGTLTVEGDQMGDLIDGKAHTFYMLNCSYYKELLYEKNYKCLEVENQYRKCMDFKVSVVLKKSWFRFTISTGHIVVSLILIVMCLQDIFYNICTFFGPDTVRKAAGAKKFSGLSVVDSPR